MCITASANSFIFVRNAPVHQPPSYGMRFTMYVARRREYAIYVCVCGVAGHIKPCSIVHSMISNMCSRGTVHTETTVFFLIASELQQAIVACQDFSDFFQEFEKVKDIWCQLFSSILFAASTHDTHLEFRSDNNEIRLCFLCAFARFHVER